MILNSFLTKTGKLYAGFFLLLCLLGASKNSFHLFQSSADSLRLRHLKYYSDLIEKYYRIKGRYPFENGDNKVPVYVFIANHDQQQFTRPGPPFAHQEIPVAVFIQELEQVLGQQVFEFYDPQRQPEKKPNFYQYMVRGATYSLTVYLHNTYSFSKQKTIGYNAVTVSNRSNIATQAILPRRLFHNREYKQVAARKVEYQPFFEEQKNKYLHDTKTSTVARQ